MGDLYAHKGYTVLYNLKSTGVTLPQNALVTTPAHRRGDKAAGDRSLFESHGRSDRD